MGLGALLFAGTLADHYSTWWPGIIGGLRLRAHRPAGDALAADPHARAPGRRGGGRALPLRRRRRAPDQRRCRSSSRPSACSPSASSSGCGSAGAGARARSTPACASCGEHQAGARRRRRPQAGDARARRRHRARAGDGRRDGARDLRRRLRRGLPERDAGVRGDDRHRRAPGRPPHPVDELVLARRAPLRRVRLVVQRLAALRARPAAHRHDLQHERHAPAGQDVLTVFESLDDARRAHGRGRRT